MAQFEPAYAIVKKWEGNHVYAILAGDDGGETFAGIARNYIPDWPGWAAVDAEKRRRRGRIPNGTKIPAAEALVPEFYRKEIWEKKGQCHRIRNQQLANLVFDACVQHGAAGRIINRAVIEAGGKVQMVRNAKGVLRPINRVTSDTLNILNSIPAVVYPLIWQAREAHYRADDDWARFGRGWMNRLNSFPKTI